MARGVVALGVVIGVVGLAGCGMGSQPRQPGAARTTSTASANENARSLRAMQRLPMLVREGADHPWVRAFGLNPDRASRVGQVGRVEIAEVGDAGAVCLVIGDGDDQCFGTSTISVGRGYAINNDCSASAGDAMRIVGVAPARATGVTVRYSVGVTVGSTHSEQASGPAPASQTLPPGLTAAPQGGQTPDQLCEQAAQRLHTKHPGSFDGGCNHGESTLPVP